MSLLIVYRACPLGNPNKKKLISHKPDLVRACFASLVRAFRGVDCKIKVLLDKPDQEFRSIFNGFEVEESFYTSLGEGNVLSFHRQLDLALNGGGNFLLVEDDYLFLEESGNIIDGVLGSGVDFLTPYDHVGYYDKEFHDYPRELSVLSGHHFQEVKSTTLTFGGTYKALSEEIDVMKTYGTIDHKMWLDVTSRRKLLSPIPSLATHTEIEFLAPNINWSAIANQK